MTPWTVARQAPLSMEFSRQEYWSGVPFPSPGDLSNPGIEPVSPASQVDSLLLSYLGSPANSLGRCQFVVDSPKPIYLLLAVLGLRCYEAFSIAAASRVKHRLQGVQLNSYCTQA